jgi:fucose 4-O-acetylase-like acetyltransferase
MDLFNSKFVLKEKRWLWVDYDKGISIILVGYGHCYATLQNRLPALANYPFFNYIGTFLYGFRMPLFFIISGMMMAKSLNKRGLAAYIGNRNNNILYPLFVWGCIQITLEIIMNRYTHNGYSMMSYLYLIIKPSEVGVFWYLNTLYCIGVVYALLHTKVKLSAPVQVCIGAILYLLFPYLNKLNAGLFVDFSEYYIFVALGDLLSSIMLDERKMRFYTSWKFFVPLCAAFLFLQFYCTPMNLTDVKYGMRYVELNKPLLFFLQAIIGCAFSINCSFYLQKFRALTFIRVVGYHSLFIYCVQIIAMTLIRSVLMSAFHVTNVPALVLLVWIGGTVLPIFFYNFCLRYNFWWLFSFRKPERVIEGVKGEKEMHMANIQID